jgi:hypothetical protein
MWAVGVRSVTPAKPVLDHEDDGANDPAIVDSSDPVRKRKKSLDPPHLRLGKQEQISHGEASSPYQ